MAKKKELTEEQRLKLEKLYKKGIKEGKIKGKKGSKSWWDSFTGFLGGVGDFITKDIFGFTGKKGSKEEKGILDSAWDYLIGTQPGEKKVDLLPKDAQKARKKFLARAEEKILGPEPYETEQKELIKRGMELAGKKPESEYDKRAADALKTAEQRVKAGVPTPYASEIEKSLSKLEKSAEERTLPGQTTLNELIERARAGTASPSEMQQLAQNLVKTQAERAKTGFEIPYQDVYGRALQQAEQRVREPQALPYESEIGNLLSKGFARLEEPLPKGPGFEAEEALTRQKFAEETLPGLFHKFTPGGALKSGGFRHAIAKAQTDLEAQLAAQRREAGLAERRQQAQEQQQRSQELAQLLGSTQSGQKIGLEQQRSLQEQLRNLLEGAAGGGRLGLEGRALAGKELGQATTQAGEADKLRLAGLGQAIEAAAKGTDLEKQLMGLSHEQLGRLVSGTLGAGRLGLGAKELESSQLQHLLQNALTGYGLDLRGMAQQQAGVGSLLGSLGNIQGAQAGKYGQLANLGFQMPYQTQQVPGQVGFFGGAQQAFAENLLPLAIKAGAAYLGLPGL